MTSKPFIHDNFLLENDAAAQLYYDYAVDMPILDYHCHLPPDEIADNTQYPNIAAVWLGGDHYKWRAMRANGVDETYCTGDAPDREKFVKWAETVPKLLRNPLYHWTHLELARYFDITDRLLSAKTADEIWETCNTRLSESAFSCRSLMERSNVVLVCTTDDPTDTLEHHRRIAEDAAFSIRVIPAWRPDKAMAVESPEVFNAWVDRLADASGTDINEFETFMEALGKRHAYFHQMGCRLSDHGLESIFAEEYTGAEIETAFDRIRSGKTLSCEQVLKFKSAMLYEFGVMDNERDWTQQYHLGALRNANTRMFSRLGPDTGFDSIGDFEYARPLAALLDRLEKGRNLARTILYNVHPRDNAMLATMIGNYQDGSVPGKMQWGSGWWHLDQKDGMEQQLETLSQMGVLSRFVGMLTDSRSFLSFTRHEYFRRILCNMLGKDIELGLIPRDFDLVGQMVRDIAYNNAAHYFNFTSPGPESA